MKLEHNQCPDPFPSNTISLLAVLENQGLIYYYRGTVYTDWQGNFLKQFIAGEPIANLRASFDRNFIECERMSVNEFIKRYEAILKSCDYIYGTYLREDDYFRIMLLAEGGNPDSHIRIKRLTKENHFVANYISCLRETESSENEIFSYISTLIYDNSEVVSEYGDGICQIISDSEAGFCDMLEYNPYFDGYARIERHVFKTSSHIKLYLLGGIILQHRVLVGAEKNSLFLDVVPYEIHFGPQWGDTIPKMMDSYTTIPARTIETFDFIGTDIVAIGIGDKRQHKVDVASEFGYAPKEIECGVEIDANASISFTIKDMATGKEKIYNLKDLWRQHKRDWL